MMMMEQTKRWFRDVLTSFCARQQTSPSASQATASSPASQSPLSASGTANHFGKSLFCAPHFLPLLIPFFPPENRLAQGPGRLMT
jgi:hypothetical protein